MEKTAGSTENASYHQLRKDLEAEGTASMDDRRMLGRGAWMASECWPWMVISEDERSEAQRPAKACQAKGKESER